MAAHANLELGAALQRSHDARIALAGAAWVYLDPDDEALHPQVRAALAELGAAMAATAALSGGAR